MKQIYLTFVLLILSLKLFGQGYKPSYTKVKEERYGDGQYWEYDAYNYQNYPYTLFDHTSNISLLSQKDSFIDKT
ncbi:MAG: hypothetical protein ACOVK9_04140 [Bacteroidia bacterium]